VRRPKPGRTLASAGQRLQGVRYVAADVLYVIARVPRAIGRGIGGFWRGLSIHGRRRLLAALGVVIALVLFFGLAVPNLPCQVPGGDSCPPPDDAEELVPADALAYLHANLDPETEQYEHAAGLAERVPVFSGQILGRALAQLPGPGGRPPDFEREIRPWFDGEAAVAVVGVADSAEQVVLLEVSDAEGATRFANQMAAGRPRPDTYQGLELSVDARGLATAQVEAFLVIGTREGVRAVIDAATSADGARSLADDETAEEVRETLPDQRFVEAYVSREGVGSLIEGSRGVLGSLTPLISPGATRGAAAALSASDDGGLELAVRSGLDPERANSSPGFFSAFPAFEPSLPERLDDSSLGYLGIGEPQGTVRALLAQASAQAPGIAAGFEDLVDSLRREGEVDIERELLEALRGEAAFALEPRPDDAGPALPYLEFVADDVDEERARRALASLQGPLADAVRAGGDLQAPVFGQQEIAGVEARSMRVSPAVELTYAVFDGLAVVATDPAGIEQLADGDGGLDESELYERATDGFDDDVSLLAFLDLGGLVELGEQLGLAEDPVYATFAGEFRSLEALGLAVTDTDELLSTDARLLLSEPQADEGAAESIAPPSD
jgi:Protein of unknown function (DUF3352)